MIYDETNVFKKIIKNNFGIESMYHEWLGRKLLESIASRGLIQD